MTGARDTADVIENWEEYRQTMAVVRDALLEFRSSCSEFCDLAGACGLSPVREPPIGAGCRSAPYVGG